MDFSQSRTGVTHYYIAEVVECGTTTPKVFFHNKNRLILAYKGRTKGEFGRSGKFARKASGRKRNALLKLNHFRHREQKARFFVSVLDHHFRVRNFGNLICR
jgi:hypothetical protein